MLLRPAKAITSAMDDNVRHTIAIAFGSSIQTALLLTPAMVVLGWIIGTEFTVCAALAVMKRE